MYIPIFHYLQEGIKMKKLKNSNINMILIVTAFIFNILIFAPIEIFYTNRNEFWFTLNDFIQVIIIVSISAFVIMILCAVFFKNKKRDIFLKIVFALLTGLYIQGNFLNFGYAVLDGTSINWNTMIWKGILNSLIWILIIILPYGIKKLKKEENYKAFTSIISLAIIIIEISTLITLKVSQPKKNIIVSGLKNENIFSLSKNNNIIVFMSDTFEATYMTQILEEHPGYKNKLEDFTYFDNCTGVSFFTYSSMPTLLTGVECKVGNTLEENLNHCFENTKLYDILKENDYSTEIYTENSLIPKYSKMDNLGLSKEFITLSTREKLAMKMYKCTMYRYLPHFLKSGFNLSNDEFYNIKKDNRTLTYLEKTYFLDDVEFNNQLIKNGITVNSNKNVFKFYETNGLHTPYNTIPDLEYDYTDEYSGKTDKEKMYNEGLASLNLLCNYIDELKKANIYNNTTIIFLADHGYYNRFYTTLLVKKAEDSHTFKTSSAPVSLSDDLIPTILNIATKSKNYGKDFFDYNENEKRARQVQNFTYENSLMSGNKYNVISKAIYETKGLAKDKNSFYIIKEEYENEEKKLTEKYTFGKTVKVKEAKDSSNLNLAGFTFEDVNFNVPYGCNISKNAYLTINKQNSPNDVTAKFKLFKVYDSKQTINFKINGEIIYSCIVYKNKNKEIEFKIPKEIWNSNENITIEMEFPDATLGKVYPTMSIAIQLNSLQFTN